MRASATALKVRASPVPALTMAWTGFLGESSRRPAKKRLMLAEVLDEDEVAALFAVGVATGAFEHADGAGVLELLGEVVDDGGHAAFVLLAGAVDVEVAEADDGGFDVVHAAAEPVVEDELGVAVDVEGLFVFGDFLEDFGQAVGGGGGGVDEGDLVVGGEGEEGFGVVEVVVHHVAAVVFEGVGAGSLVEDGGDLGVVEVAFEDGFDEVELVHVVGVVGALEVEELGAGEVGGRGEVVDDEDVLFADGVELVDEVGADEACSSGDDDHDEFPLLLSLSTINGAQIGPNASKPFNDCYGLGGLGCVKVDVD